MISQLRKRHFQIWSALLILIPLGIMSAVLVRPKFSKDKLLQPGAENALPVLLRSLDLNTYNINIRTNTDTSVLQLEWINKEALTYPTLAIYQVRAENDSLAELPVESGLPDSIATTRKSELIGRIESRGTYRFYLTKDKASASQQKASIFHFILYDFVHKKIISIIKLV